MLVIRPITQADLPELLRLAEESGHGFTSLPVNETLLQKKIERAVNAFASDPSKPGDELYLFVAQDCETGKIVGTSGIEAAVGLDEAFYHYHLSKVVHSSRELNVYKTSELLTLCNDYTGSTEICTLFLSDAYRQNFNGKLLSKCRFLFMAENRHRFGSRVFAEMRGISDEKGRSPFWRWLDDNFFSMDFPTADYLTGIGQKGFIAELMPKHPIYVNLLSNAAQKVIGQVHDNTKPALRLLQKEGFAFRGYVDIFDAGPTVEAELEHVRSARNSHKVTVHIGQSNDKHPYLISNTKVKTSRAMVLETELDNLSQAIWLTTEQAELLAVSEGDSVRVLDLLR